MPTTSAGLLLYRRLDAADAPHPGAGGVEVLLGHMGGPFWSRKHEGAWTILKGELDPDEEPHAAALREAAEELGIPVPPPRDPGTADEPGTAGLEGTADLGGTPDLDLGEIRQRAGKRVRAWAREVAPDAVDLSILRSNTTEIEWPPRSGRRLEVPEIDRYAWFPLDAARLVVVQAQAELLDRLEALAATPVRRTPTDP